MSRADFPSAKQDCLPAHIGLPDTKMRCRKKRKRVDLAQKTALYHHGTTLQGLQLFKVICVGQSETFSYRTITGESTQSPKGFCQSTKHFRTGNEISKILNSPSGLPTLPLLLRGHHVLLTRSLMCSQTGQH